MKNKQANAGPYVSVDANTIRQNVTDFADAFPFISLAYDVAKCGDVKVLQFLEDTISPRIVSCNNKNEVKEGLKVVGPDQMALLNPIKPTSHIKFSLNQGVKMFGCGSVAELLKIERCVEQSGAQDVQILVTLDCSEPDNHYKFQDQALDILQRSKDSNISVVGVSFFNNTPSTLLRHFDGSVEKYQDAIRKFIAVARVVFESGTWMGLKMKIFDTGHILDIEEGNKELQQISSMSTWEQLCSQFSTYDSGSTTGPGMANIEVLCHATNWFLRKTLTLSVEIVYKFMNRNRQSVVVNESIYGAFQGIMAGDVYNDIDSSSARNTKKISIDVFGDSGEDVDVIAEDIKIDENFEVGDRLFFPNLGSAASFGLCDGLPIFFSSASETTVWDPTPKPRLETSCRDDNTHDEEFDNAFALPDISDDILQSLL